MSLLIRWEEMKEREKPKMEQQIILNLESSFLTGNVKSFNESLVDVQKHLLTSDLDTVCHCVRLWYMEP